MNDKGSLPGDSQEGVGKRANEDFHTYVRVVERRVWLIVIPALIAFILLAAYGFYLIFSLTRDMHAMEQQMTAMSSNVRRNMNIMAGAMTAMSPNVQSNMDKVVAQMSLMRGSIQAMAKNIDLMQVEMSAIDTKMGKMNIIVDDIDAKMGKMNASITYMAWAVAQLQADMWSMNQNISTPFSMFSAFVPWSNNQGPYPAPSRPLPPPSGVGPPPQGSGYYPPPKGMRYYRPSPQNPASSRH